MTVSISHGEGLLAVGDDYIAFASARIEGWFELFNDRLAGVDSVAFSRALASLVVEHNFELPPFVVIQRGSGSMFCFGDVELTVGDGTLLRGADASTWVEQSLDLVQLRGLQVGPPPSPDTSLTAGCVLAGGFAFGTLRETQRFEGDNSTDRVSGAARGLEVPPLATLTPAAVDYADPADGSSADVLVRDAAEVDEEDDWDPLAEPTGIDLAKIGASPADSGPDELQQVPEELGAVDQFEPRPSETQREPSPPVDSEGAAIEAHADLSSPVRPAPLIVESSSYEMHAAEVSSHPEPMGTADRTVPSQAPKPHAESHIGERSSGEYLEFDDGQVVSVGIGVYVGRFPTKRGLPEGYNAAVTRSENVSRVHWELLRGLGGLVLVRDLGSENGTTFLPVGATTAEQVPTDEGVTIDLGTTIYFGDRWAVFSSASYRAEPGGYGQSVPPT